MTKTIQYGWIENGILFISNRKRFDAHIKEFPDCDVQIVTKKKGKRSTQANNYYWGVLIEEIRLRFLELGDRYTPEEIHEGFKSKFNPKSTANKDSGEIIFETGESTTDMNKEEFSLYMSCIIEWANKNLEIEISEPNTQTKLFAV